MKMEVFDPPMCCSSGVCGPKVDKKLVEFSAALAWLRTQGVEVQRHNPTQQHEAFIQNPKVMQTVNELGTDCLPIILVDGEVARKGSYPERDELALLARIENGKVPTV